MYNRRRFLSAIELLKTFGNSSIAVTVRKLFFSQIVKKIKKSKHMSNKEDIEVGSKPLEDAAIPASEKNPSKKN